jgi:hypothetical protein
LVPVAIQGALASGDQAKALVRGISLKRTMAGELLSALKEGYYLRDVGSRRDIKTKQKVRSCKGKEQDRLIHKATMVHVALCFVDSSFRSGHNNALPKMPTFRFALIVIARRHGLYN